MTDTLWADTAEFQIAVTNAYPYGLFAFRSNDGTHLDDRFDENMAWARKALAAGRLWGIIVYYFYRPGSDGAAVLRSRVGKPPGRLAVMIDVESDQGRITGNQSAKINREFGELAAWLGDKRRVIGYGNTSDLNALWPSKPPGARLVVASYGSNPSYPGKFAHQFSDVYHTAPFGPCDINSADGMSAADLETMFGFAPPAGPPPPGFAAAPAKVADGAWRWVTDGSGLTLTAFARGRGASATGLLALSWQWLSDKNKALLEAYVTSGGVNSPMPPELIIYTANR